MSLHKLLNLIPTVKSEQFNRLFWIYSRILDLLRGGDSTVFCNPLGVYSCVSLFFIQLSSAVPIKFGASVFHNTDFTSLAIMRKKILIIYYIIFPRLFYKRQLIFNREE